MAEKCDDGEDTDEAMLAGEGWRGRMKVGTAATSSSATCKVGRFRTMNLILFLTASNLLHSYDSRILWDNILIDILGGSFEVYQLKKLSTFSFRREVVSRCRWLPEH